MDKLELKVPPPVVALLVAALMWGLGQLLPGLQRLPAAPTALVVVLAAVGVGIGVAGFLGFRRQATTIDPLHPDKATALVTGGVYRYTRNPMYLGLTVVLSAWALRLGAAAAWFGPLLFVAWITRFQIVPEERALRALFGDSYRAYVARVRRWL